MSVLPRTYAANFNKALRPCKTKGTIYRAPTTDSEHEKQKTQRRTRVETIGRLGGAAAAPLGLRPRGVFSSAAAQPARREAAASLFHSVARSRCRPFRLGRTQSGAAP